MHEEPEEAVKGPSARRKRSVPARTVQQYIDETPAWPDGTRVGLTPMTAMQWRIWFLASAGKFFEGLVVFMTGVALPLIQKEFSLGATAKGAVGAAVLAGILVGALALGGLSDRFGRKRMFVAEMVIFLGCLVFLVLSSGFHWMLALLFGMGLALGCDYPTAHMIISESIPTGQRGRLVLSAFGFQAVGALAGTAVGYLVLANNPELGAWRWMFATAVIPAALVLAGRFFITDSAHWLLAKGKVRQAEHETRRLLDRTPPYPSQVRLAEPEGGDEEESRPRFLGGFRQLFCRRCRRATILASVPWFLQDLGTYGIGIFTPVVLASVLGAQTEHPHNLAALIHGDMIAAKGAALVDVLLLIGIVCAVLLADRVGRIRLQIIGFLGCAAGLALAAVSMDASGPARLVLIFAGFMLFNFMTNLGPNAMTYLLAGEVFPTRIRGQGAGFAAAFAKLGAVLTAFLFPVLLKDIGTGTLLTILVCTSLTGAAVTWFFGIETAGVSLEEIENGVSSED